MMTSGLIRSLGLSFISISAGSTLSRPVNVWVISFSGWMRPDMTRRFPVLRWDIPAASPPAWILLFVRAAVLLEVVSAPMNTPALLGENHTNEQEYFLWRFVWILIGKPTNLWFIAVVPKRCFNAINFLTQCHKCSRFIEVNLQ